MARVYESEGTGYARPPYDNNPKTAQGIKKVPLHLVPPSAKHYLAMAMSNGAEKYGPYNFRDLAISISTYKAAAERHLDAFWDGEDLAEDSGVHHVAHAMACCALILDAMSIGKLVDDRPTEGASPRLQKEYLGTKETYDRAEQYSYPVEYGRISYIQEDLQQESWWRRLFFWK